MKKKILLTGGKGMVGRNIAEKTNLDDYDLYAPSSKELNLLDKHNLLKYLEEKKPDIVIHAAGLVGGIQANISNPVGFLVQNTEMGLNLVTSSYQVGVKVFMNLGSSCMYPRNVVNPLNEDVILKGELEPTNEGYALSKIVITKLCEYISRTNDGFQYKTLIPCNLYGKYDKFGMNNSHMIPAAIKRIHEAKINKVSNVDIWGDGTARREFMYAEDLADFVFYALKNFEEMPQNINVGLGMDYTIDEYYQAIAHVIGYDGKFNHDTTKPIGMQQKLIDDTRLTNFGWKYKTNLLEGLKKTYDWYLNKQENETL